MDNTFLLNPASTPIQLKDAINDRLIKTKAVITCIMFGIEFLREEMRLDASTIYDALWTVDDLLEEIEILQNAN